jgi:hypothetical protein
MTKEPEYKDKKFKGMTFEEKLEEERSEYLAMLDRRVMALEAWRRGQIMLGTVTDDVECEGEFPTKEPGECWCGKEEAGVMGHFPGCPGGKPPAEEPDIERLAEVAHMAWLEWKLTVLKTEPKDYRVPYSELDEDVKDADRMVVRAILKELGRMPEPEQGGE